MSGQINQELFLTEATRFAVRKLYGTLFIQGVAGSDTSFPGLDAMIGLGAGVSSSIASTAVLPVLEDALDKLWYGNRNLGDLLIVLRNADATTLLQEQRIASGSVPLTFEPFRGRSRVMHYAGIPICVNDNINLQAGENVKLYILDRSQVFAIAPASAPDVSVSTDRHSDQAGSSIQVTWTVGAASLLPNRPRPRNRELKIRTSTERSLT